MTGDNHAFTEFYHRYIPRLYRSIFFAAGNHSEDAEDILQETMLAVTRNLRRFEGNSRLYTWLYSIAQHKLHDFFRRQKRDRTHLDPVPSEDLDLAVPAEEGALIRKDDFERAFQRLPGHYRTVLVGKYIDGFSVSELAVVMQRSEKSIESLLTRAREALRTEINNASF